MNPRREAQLKGCATLVLMFTLVFAVSAAAGSNLDSHGLQRLLDSHRGKVVLVDFWATWCPPCRTDIPALVQLYQQHKDAGLEVIGVSLDRDEASVARFIRDHGVTYPVYLAGDQLRRNQRIFILPTSVLINRNGDTIMRHVGSLPISQLDAEIRVLLKH